ncbi:MAG: enoyl-CoA hydratase/isomerase family protein [Clostridia bacterium]|nr:enoyl-CoA hydratase/isomerase family protein [Clostridia bacterium]
MAFNDLLWECRDNIGYLTLNRPQVRNALSLKTMEELAEAVSLAADPAVRVLVITGAGEAFCAGGDLRDIEAYVAAGNSLYDRMTGVARLVRTLAGLPKPVIAAVNGAAVGAGWSLALACDLIVASENAFFSMAFTRVGLVPDFGAHYFLPRLVGLSTAKYLVFTGERLGAREAERLGLVSLVVAPEALAETVEGLARRLAAGPPQALALSKSLLDRSLALNLEGVLEEEALAQALATGSADGREGMRAFLEKRQPVFRGR